MKLFSGNLEGIKASVSSWNHKIYLTVSLYYLKRVYLNRITTETKVGLVSASVSGSSFNVQWSWYYGICKGWDTLQQVSQVMKGITNDSYKGTLCVAKRLLKPRLLWLKQYFLCQHSLGKFRSSSFYLPRRSMLEIFTITTKHKW